LIVSAVGAWAPSGAAAADTSTDQASFIVRMNFIAMVLTFGKVRPYSQNGIAKARRFATTT
jgi:hypothetical protein